VFLFLFVTLLPSGMISELEKVGSAWMVIPLATVVSYVFYVLMRVGEFNKDPFEGCSQLQAAVIRWKWVD
jgi:hypothetical protein